MQHESVENVGEKNVAFSGGGRDVAALRVKSQTTMRNTNTARIRTHLQLRRAVAEGSVLLTRDVEQSRCSCALVNAKRQQGTPRSDLRAGGDAVDGQMYVFGVAQACVEAAGHVSERGVTAALILVPRSRCRQGEQQRTQGERTR
jgi:hypothetical protein